MAKKLEVEIVADASKYAKGLKDAETKTGKFSKAAGIAGTALMGGLVVGLTKSTQAAMDAQKVQSQTESQLKALGISYKDHSKQIDTAIQSTSKLAAIDDEDLQTAFNNLVRTSGSVKKGLHDTALAADIARGKGISLQAATKLVTNAELGKAGALTKAGLAAKKGATPLELLNTLHKKFSGAAEAYGKTAAGSQERFKVAIENLQESLGKMLLPTIEKVAGALSKMAGFLEEHKTITKILVGVVGALAGVLLAASAATKIWSAATKIMAAMQWLLNAALSANPIGLVIIAVAALGAALVIAYKKSETFRDIVKGALDVVKTAIGALKTAFEAVLGFMRDHWKVIAVLISGPFAPLVALATNAFGIRSALVGAFEAVKKATKGLVGDVAGFFTALPGKIGGAISGAMGDLWSALKKIFDPKVWKDKILGFLGFGSPSPFFVDIGKNMITSIAHGVGKFSGVVWDAVKEIVGKLNPFGGSSQGGGVSGKGGTGVGKEGSTLALLMGWANQEGIRVTSTNTGGHVKGSYHYQNRAIDVAGSGSQMAKFFLDTIKRFGVGNITELFYDPMGYYVDNGRAVTGRIGGHSDHVHLALAAGGIVRSPTMALVGERGPEAVIPLSRGGGLGMNVVVHVHGSVMSERDLAISIRDELVRAGNRSGGSMFAGTA